MSPVYNCPLSWNNTCAVYREKVKEKLQEAIIYRRLFLVSELKNEQGKLR